MNYVIHMTHDVEKDLRTTVTIPDNITSELMVIVNNIKKSLPIELSKRISPAFVISMIVRDWIRLYKEGKVSIERLISGPKKGDNFDRYKTSQR